MAAAIPLAIGAVAGGIQGDQERSAIRRQNIGKAEANRFADVTGFRQELSPEGGGAFGGAIKGAGAFAPLAGGFGGATSGVADVGGQSFVSGASQSPGQFGSGGFSGGQTTNTFGQLNA